LSNNFIKVLRLGMLGGWEEMRESITIYGLMKKMMLPVSINLVFYNDILYRLGIRAGAVDMIAEYQPRLGVYFFYMYIAGFRGIITLTKDQFWELVELADKIIKDLIVLEGEINTE